MATNIEGFDPESITTSRLMHVCERCADLFQVGTRIENVGDMIWYDAKCPSCGTPVPLSFA